MGSTDIDVDDSALARVVREHLGDAVSFDHPVAESTTYRVGGRAAFHFVARSVADLQNLAHLRTETGLPVVVVGRGSNVLFADDGFPGLVVQLGEFASGLDLGPAASDDTNSVVTVRVGGGVALPVAARQLTSAGLRGFEWAVGVPGTVGGAVRMNAGGHGSDMAHGLRSAEIFDLRTGVLRTAEPSELNLRFRGSDLDDADIVLSVDLELHRGSSTEGMALIDDIVRWRREHQPGGQNAGSVFVNPVPGTVSAGELIDRCGLRGLRFGSAAVSEKHANFIQADPGGRAEDVLAVMREVRDIVERETGFRLRSEIRLVGFDDATVADLHGTEHPNGDVVARRTGSVTRP